VAGSKLIVVLGHSRCGAVKGACNHVQLGHLTGLLGKIGPAVYEVQKAGGAPLPPDELVERVALENARHQMRAILARSAILEHMFSAGKIGIVGGMYSVESGEVSFFEEQFNDGRTASTDVPARKPEEKPAPAPGEQAAPVR
jgi:carbonic anhydrase